MSTVEQETVGFCQELLRMDTSNYGDGSGPGERKAAEWVATQLSDVGLETTVVESDPGRTSVLTRLRGSDDSRPALLLHGHLDVVPAVAADWQVDPFSGEEVDGYLWGRGAIDMKDVVAMQLAVARGLVRDGTPPPRDIVFAFVADEEAGGRKGAHHLVDTVPELFEGCTEAVGEVGGFSFELTPGQRYYALETAQKGIAWLRLTANGRAGHGSFKHDDNAVTTLAAAVARIGQHEFPRQLIPTVQRLLEELADGLGLELDLDHPEPVLERIGNLARIVGATLTHTANPTMLSAGYKANVIPGQAVAHIDGRFLPGGQQELLDTIAELAGPGIEIDPVHLDVALETAFGGATVEAMTAAIQAEDPGAKVVPYCLSGGTDGKAFSRLGMTAYGFGPLLLPPDLDFTALFHGIDERVPISGLEFGARALQRYLLSC
jgi:acetylornithine deacetylase/succinyl-diaminopimelate desuccinylase-like protein